MSQNRCDRGRFACRKIGGNELPRYARKVSETNIYHIMIRGNERKNIFNDFDDKLRFIDTLKRMKEKNEYELYTYCLMDNHVHLLIKELKDPIHRSMKRIQVSYSYYFNKKYQRIGHLFQDRYKSEVIATDEYLLECARYIHNNPVKAEIVNAVTEYQWSSFKDFIGLNNNTNRIVEIDMILGIYSTNREKAILQFIEYTNQNCDKMFIDLNKETLKNESETIDSEKEIISKILEDYQLDVKGLANLEDKLKRKKIIFKIKQGSNLSIRELSRLLCLSKDIIFRA